MSDFWLLAGVVLLALELWSARKPGAAQQAIARRPSLRRVEGPFHERDASSAQPV